MLFRFVRAYIAFFNPPVAAAVAATAVVGSVATAAMAPSPDNSATDAAASSSQLQGQIAQDQWNTYKSTYQPLEQQTVADAQNYASPANYEKAAGDAQSAVSQQFGAQKASLARAPGMDPSSGAYQAGITSLGLQEAATGATAQNAARTNVRDTAFNRELNAVSLGKGIPAAASNAAGSAANTNMGLSNMEYGRATQTAAGIGNIASGVANGVSNWATKSPGLGSVTNPQYQSAYSGFDNPDNYG